MSNKDNINESLVRNIEEKVWSEFCVTTSDPIPPQSHCPDDDEDDEYFKNVEIRVFISSTFTDFFAEREFLVKFVIPRLRSWCGEHQLRLVEVDLRWGVPSASSVDVTLLTCLGEIDRCKGQNNGHPFFINMLGDRYGWVPKASDISPNIKRDYNWVDGASVTHMEILHGAYRINNPNALFMLRSDNFVKDLPSDFVDKYVDSDEYSRASLALLKDHIRQKFDKKSQVFDYSLDYEGIDESTVSMPKVNFLGLSEFGEIIFDFMQRAIAREYLSCDKYTDDSHSSESYVELRRAKQRLASPHKNFYLFRESTIFGRDAEIKKIVEWLFSDANTAPSKRTSNVPYVIFGERKVGKSTLMCADTMMRKMFNFKTVFHSVEAEENLNALTSIDDPFFLQSKKMHSLKVFKLRLCLELGDEDMYSRLSILLKGLSSIEDISGEDVEALVSFMFKEEKFHRKISLSNPAVIFLDDADQLQGDVRCVAFLQFPLPKCIKCVLSTSNQTFFKTVQVTLSLQLDDQESQKASVISTAEQTCGNGNKIESQQSYSQHWQVLSHLDKSIAASVIRHRLSHFQKTLDEEQLVAMLSNDGAVNFEWVEYACEEIRTFGAFETISQHIKNLPSSVPELLLLRLKNNETIACNLDGRTDYVALMHLSLRLLLICESGLEEEEIRMMLSKAADDHHSSQMAKLEYSQWSAIYLLIRPFIFYSRFHGQSSRRIIIRSDAVRRTLIRKFSMLHLQEVCHGLQDRDVETYNNINLLLQLFYGSPSRERHVFDYPLLLLAIADKSRLYTYMSSEYFELCSFTVKYRIKSLLRCQATIPLHPHKPHSLKICINCSMKSTLSPKRLNRMSCYCCRSMIFSRYQTIGGKHSVVMNVMESEAFMCRRHCPQSYNSLPHFKQPCVICKLPLQDGFCFPVVLCRDCNRKGICMCAHMA